MGELPLKKGCHYNGQAECEVASIWHVTIAIHIPRLKWLSLGFMGLEAQVTQWALTS